VADDPLALGRTVAGGLLRWIVVTAGAAGARASSEAEVLDAPAQTAHTVDTTGAGDAFAAGLLHALVSGAPMRDALALAVRFGTEATRWPTSGLPAQAVRRLLQ
jgi:sugar/nucleoside kinase (ribokinase family)